MNERLSAGLAAAFAASASAGVDAIGRVMDALTSP
jgi:hypothetical protein